MIFHDGVSSCNSRAWIVSQTILGMAEIAAISGQSVSTKSRIRVTPFRPRRIDRSFFLFAAGYRIHGSTQLPQRECVRRPRCSRNKSLPDRPSNEAILLPLCTCESMARLLFARDSRHVAAAAIAVVAVDNVHLTPISFGRIGFNTFQFWQGRSRSGKQRMTEKNWRLRVLS